MADLDPAARYLRLRQVEGFDAARLRALHVAVAGAGAIGNEVVKNLALLGVGRVSLFDFDKVELHNLTRSVLLREEDIGRHKAQAVAQRAMAIDRAVQVDALCGDIRQTLTISLLRQCDLLVCGVDNIEARIRLNQLCRLAGTPWVNAAIDSRFASVELYPNDAPDAVPLACYECALPDAVYQRLAERQSCGGLRRAAQARQLVATTPLTSSLAGALAVGQALLLAGVDRRVPVPAVSQRVFMDTLTGVSSRLQLAVSQWCPGCGSTPRAVRWQPAMASPRALADWLRDGLHDERPAHQVVVRLGDPLVWHCVCRRCGPSSLTGRWVGQVAALLDDSITRCPGCGHQSVDVEIRDRLVLSDLLDFFGDRPVPGAWAAVDEHHFEWLGHQGA